MCLSMKIKRWFLKQEIEKFAAQQELFAEGTQDWNPNMGFTNFSEQNTKFWRNKTRLSSSKWHVPQRAMNTNVKEIKKSSKYKTSGLSSWRNDVKRFPGSKLIDPGTRTKKISRGHNLKSKKSVFRSSATLSRIGLMESCHRHGGPPLPFL